MALTKVTSNVIADDAITSAMIAPGAIDDTHITGITTTDIAEGTNQYYTDGKVGTYLNINGYDTATNIISAITDTAPITLDTLNELAAALGDDPNFATTTATSLGLKAPLASPNFTGAVTFSGNVVFNENGNDSDFRVETVGNANMFVIDASNSTIGIGTQPVNNSLSPAMHFYDGGTLFGFNSVMYITGNTYYNNGWKALATGGGANGIFDASGFKVYTTASVAADSVTTPILRFTAGPTETVVNDDSYDYDFRVESDTNTHALFVDASENRVHAGGLSSGSVGTAQFIVAAGSVGSSVGDTLRLNQTYYGTGSNGSFFTNRARRTDANGVWTGVVVDTVLEVDNSAAIYTYLTYGIGNLVVNETGANLDFRVESSGNANMLFVDASNNVVNIGTSGLSTTGAKLAVQGPAEFNTDSGTNKIYITRSGATNQSGSFYVDDNTFVFDSLQDEPSGANFLFRGTNATASNVSYLELDYAGGTCFNQGASSQQDFRVESGTNAHALFLDAGTDVLTLGYSARNGAFLDKAATGFQIGTPGVDNNGGHMFMTQTAPESTWMDICACHDNGATGVLFLIHGVRTIDQNRSYGALVRYAYPNTFNVMSVNEQNTAIAYRVSGNVLQYQFTSPGPYVVNLTIMAAG